MSKCTYCGKTYPDHQGMMVVDSVTSKIRYFCSSKCRKNAWMTRKKKKWTKPAPEQIAK